MLRCGACGERYPDGTRFCPRDGTDMTPGLERGKLAGVVLDGRYRVGPLIGQGGIGQVYLAEHLAMGKRVAIKVLSSELAVHDDYRRRFDREARAASRLHHLNCVAVTDYGRTANGISYLVMEHLEGQSLREVVGAGRPALSRTLNIFIQLLRGLGHAHAEGIVHRDLKPANVILLHDKRSGRADHVKILDFGLAKIIDAVGQTEDATLTRAGTILGTPAYISPEQAAGDEVDHRGDVYSVGVMLFELLCGQRPFVSDEAVELIRAHVLEPAPDPRALRPDLSAELAEAVLRALRKKPGERFQSAGELQGALERSPEWQAALAAGLFSAADTAGDSGDASPAPRVPHGGAPDTESFEGADLVGAPVVPPGLSAVPRLVDRQRLSVAAVAGLLLAVVAGLDSALGERADGAAVGAAASDAGVGAGDGPASGAGVHAPKSKKGSVKGSGAGAGAAGTGAGAAGGGASSAAAGGRATPGGGGGSLGNGGGDDGDDDGADGASLPGDSYKDNKVRRAAKLIEVGNLKEAYKLVDDVIRRDEFHVEALALRGRIHAARGESNAALDDYNKALRFDAAGTLRDDPIVSHDVVWSMATTGKKAYNIVLDRIGAPALPELVAAAAAGEQRDLVYWARRALDTLEFGRPGSGWQEAARALAFAADCPGRKVALEKLAAVARAKGPASPIVRALVRDGAGRAGCPRDLAARAAELSKP
ncbi:MAG TPA: protein kinase [Myxococcota bacterium]|nr:protein kinase [Myxococcota bacterium]